MLQCLNMHNNMNVLVSYDLYLYYLLDLAAIEVHL
jgi:hypothetical protein